MKSIDEKLDKFLHEQFELQKENYTKGWPCILCEKVNFIYMNAIKLDV